MEIIGRVNSFGWICLFDEADPFGWRYATRDDAARLGVEVRDGETLASAFSRAGLIARNEDNDDVVLAPKRGAR
jgi:hypothetical protein